MDSASKNNILYSIAYTILFYSIFLVSYTFKLYSTGIIYLLYPYIFFLQYMYIFILKAEISNLITVVINPFLCLVVQA
jgi:predicted membrane protein